jgi:hypothetical protein
MFLPPLPPQEDRQEKRGGSAILHWICEIPPHQDEGVPLLTNLLIRGKVVS